MKCKICKEKSLIRLRAHNISLCKDHFLSFVLDRVQKAIRTYQLFAVGERILVAISGGKDSLALFEILQRLGYPVEGLHVDMGIEGFSDQAIDTVAHFLTDRRAPFHLYSLLDVAGVGITRMASRLKRPPCTLCGMMRRYLMNRFAWEHGFSSLATGHNLDDEGATLLGNTTNWHVGYLAKQAPLLPASHPRLVKKVKPLVLLSEREVLAYSILRELPYQEERCPHARGATSVKNKIALNLIEYHSPGTKIRFYQEFQKNRTIFSQPEPTHHQSCSVCGFLTTREKCQFCTIVQRFHDLDSAPSDSLAM